MTSEFCPRYSPVVKKSNEFSSIMLDPTASKELEINAFISELKIKLKTAILKLNSSTEEKLKTTELKQAKMVIIKIDTIDKEIKAITQKIKTLGGVNITCSDLHTPKPLDTRVYKNSLQPRQ